MITFCLVMAVLCVLFGDSNDGCVGCLGIILFVTAIILVNK